jgi:hypothetical protein
MHQTLQNFLSHSCEPWHIGMADPTFSGTQAGLGCRQWLFIATKELGRLDLGTDREGMCSGSRTEQPQVINEQLPRLFFFL